MAKPSVVRPPVHAAWVGEPVQLHCVQTEPARQVGEVVQSWRAPWRAYGRGGHDHTVEQPYGLRVRRRSRCAGHVLAEGAQPRDEPGELAGAVGGRSMVGGEDLADDLAD